MWLQKNIWEEKIFMYINVWKHACIHYVPLAKVVLNVEFLECDWLTTSGWKFNVFARSQQLNDNFLTKYEVAIFYKLRST